MPGFGADTIAIERRSSDSCNASEPGAFEAIPPPGADAGRAARQRPASQGATTGRHCAGIENASHRDVVVGSDESDVYFY